MFFVLNHSSVAVMVRLFLLAIPWIHRANPLPLLAVVAAVPISSAVLPLCRPGWCYRQRERGVVRETVAVSARGRPGPPQVVARGVLVVGGVAFDCRTKPGGH